MKGVNVYIQDTGFMFLIELNIVEALFIFKT
jgi:hypothetical protein